MVRNILEENKKMQNYTVSLKAGTQAIEKLMFSH